MVDVRESIRSLQNYNRISLCVSWDTSTIYMEPWVPDFGCLGVQSTDISRVS